MTPYDTNVPKLQKKKGAISYIKVTAGQSFEPGNLDLVQMTGTSAFSVTKSVIEKKYVVNIFQTFSQCCSQY